MARQARPPDWQARASLTPEWSFTNAHEEQRVPPAAALDNDLTCAESYRNDAFLALLPTVASGQSLRLSLDRVVMYGQG